LLTVQLWKTLIFFNGGIEADLWLYCGLAAGADLEDTDSLSQPGGGTGFFRQPGGFAGHWFTAQSAALSRSYCLQENLPV
jgi:hypothetical protein